MLAIFAVLVAFSIVLHFQLKLTSLTKRSEAKVLQLMELLSPPKVVILSGDGRFAECGRLITSRGQYAEFVAFESNTSGAIKRLAQNNDLVSYRPLSSIPEAVSEVRLRKKISTPKATESLA